MQNVFLYSTLADKNPPKRMFDRSYYKGERSVMFSGIDSKHGALCLLTWSFF